LPEYSDMKEKLRSFIMEYFVKDSGIELKESSSFLEEGIIDSTGIMELVAYIESTFGIRLEDEEIIPDNFDSIEKLMNYMHTKLSPKVRS
jgi:acyl carrier protein